MTIRWSRLLFIVLSAGLAIAAPGCSCGDDDGNGDRPDAREQADAEPDIDADVAEGLLRSGTIAVTETHLTNLGLDSFAGALVRVDFSDATTGNVPAPVPGFESNVGGCLIQVWDVGTHEAPDPVDEGAVQVTGTDNGDFACAFASPALGYVCQSTNAAIAAGSLDGVTTDSNVMTFPAGGTQTAPEMVGMYMVVNGHPTIPDGSRIPIIDQDSAEDTLTLFGLPDVNLGAGDADSVFATFVGVGPVPGGAQFLRGMADTFTVQKAAGEVVAAIDEDFNAHGQGFVLVDDGDNGKYLPSNLPTDNSAATFECTTCGDEGMGGVITAIVINGETTDATVGPLDPSNPMPDPETQYATFSCSFFVTGDPPYSGELTAEAMTAILGTSPTRIQTSVARYRGALLADADGTYSTVLLQGHSQLGWTDVVE